MKQMFNVLFNRRKRFHLLVAKGFYRLLSDKAFLEKMFFIEKHYHYKFTQAPVKLDEKLQWLKLYDRNPYYIALVDKFAAKQELERIIGQKYIIPTLGVWDSFEEISFDSLPDKFILKTTHDSGTHYICTSKKSFDYQKAKRLINKGLKRNYYYAWREWPYKDVKPRIIAEPLLENNDGSPLVDYKFYCYGGKPRYFMCSIGEATHNVKNLKFDLNGTCIDYLFKNTPALDANQISLPSNIADMVEIVNKLSGISQHVRVDLFNIDGCIFVGEITFCTNAGFINISNDEYKQSLADLIDIERAFNYKEWLSNDK